MAAWKLAIACVPLMAASAAAHAGTLVAFAPDSGACPVEILGVKIDGGRFRIDTRSQELEGTLLYDHAERLMTSLMHDQRQYMQIEVDEDALDYQGDVATSTGNYMDKQFEKIEAQMAQQCADLRKQGMDCPMANMDMRGMMKGMMSSQVLAWRDTGRDGESGGVACRWWERTQGGRKVMEECSAKVAALPIAERDRRGLERGMQVMHRYGSNMMGMMKGITGDAAAPAGLPKDALSIVQLCFGPDGKESGRVVATFAEQQIAEAGFQIPSGYTQLRMQ